MKTVILSLFATLSAFGGEHWFDAGVKSYTDWPTNGDDLVVEAVGKWTNTASGSLIGESGAKRIVVNGESDLPLAWTTTKPRPENSPELVSIWTTVDFPSAYEELPAPPRNAKFSLATAVVGDTVAFFGLTKDPVGGTNVWTQFRGDVVSPVDSVNVAFDVKNENGAHFVRTTVGKTMLTDLNGREWIEVAFPDEKPVASVLYTVGVTVSAVAGPAVVADTTYSERLQLAPGCYRFTNVNFSGGLELVAGGDYTLCFEGENAAEFLTQNGAKVTIAGGGNLNIVHQPAEYDGAEFLNPHAIRNENGTLTVYGTAGASGSGMTKEKVFDGDLSTYFDPLIAANDSEGSQWAGIGFETPVMITAIKFAASHNYTQRINGCSIQGANSPDFSDAENIHLIEVDNFYDGREMSASLEDIHGPYKYLRVIGEYCGNIAELKFYGLADSGKQAPTTAPKVIGAKLVDGKPTFGVVGDAYVPQVYRVERTMVQGDGDEEAFLPLGTRSDAMVTWTASEPTPFAAYRVQGVNANGASEWTTFTIAPPRLAGDENPKFSVAPGEYADEISLELTFSDGEAEIWYTTDGSEPVDHETATCRKYTGAITLAEKPDAPAVLGKIPTSASEVVARQGKAYGYYEPTADQPFVNVIRARAFKDGVKSSGEAFGTWLIAGNGTRHKGLRVVSLLTDPGNLFADDIGIFVPGDIYKKKGCGSHSVGMPNANYFQSGRLWEREVNLELFESADHKEGFSQRVGVRVRGNWSRSAAKKSLTVYNRAEYGNKNLKYQLFGDEPDQKKFKRFLLRNGGNDWYEGNIRDAIAQDVFRGYLRTCSQGTEPSVLYINGEYWGIYNIRHGYSKQHFENWFGVDGDNLDWIKLESSDSGRKYEVQEGDIVEFLKLRQFFRNNDFTQDASLAIAREMVDFDDMIDYHIVHIFYGNKDWIANNNNVGYWRERKPVGKWRFQLYDCDSVLGLTGGATKSTDGIDKALGGDDDKIPPIFKRLSKNVTFQKMFVNRFADLLNTALKPELTTNKLAVLAGKIRPETARNVARWTNMTSVESWESQIAEINDFYLNRPAIQIGHLQRHFPGATGAMHKLSLAKEGEGEIKLNTIESGTGAGKFALPFAGDYFENSPVTLTAKPMKGTMLEKWIVNGEECSTQSTIELSLDGDVAVTAVFVGEPQPVLPTRWENTNVTERIMLPPGSYEFANANFLGGIDLEEGEYKFKNDGGSSVNSIASLNGPLANVTFTGKGRMNIAGEGDATLFEVRDLIVSNGVIAIDFTSTAEEVSAVKVTGNFLLDDRGAVEITLDGAKPRGIELPNKKMNATFAGGTLTATLKGAKASAFKFKGSDIVTFAGGTMEVEITGTDAKVIDGGTLIFEDGYQFAVTGTDAATNALVFSAGKTMTFNGGKFVIVVPGAGSTLFASDDLALEEALRLNGGTMVAVTGAGTEADVAAADWSGKFLKANGRVGRFTTTIWAKLPELAVDNISLFVFTPGIDPTKMPTATDEAPDDEFATGFHDLYLDIPQAESEVKPGFVIEVK